MKPHPLISLLRPRVVAVYATLLGAWLNPHSAGAADAPEEKPADDGKSEPARLTDEQIFEGGTNTYSNWLEVSAGGAMISGDLGSFSQRMQVKRGVSGGIEDFHYETTLGKEGTLSLDGRAIFDNRDYFFKYQMADPKVGFLRAGFKESRSWYDSSGGFFPQSGVFYDLYKDPWALDRGEFWVEGGLTLKKFPEFTFKYARQFRNGQKDSTIWGATHPAAGYGRSLSPSFYDLDEKVDVLQGDLKYRYKKTDFAVGLRYESGTLDDTLYVRQYPGEGSAIDRHLTDHQKTTYDLLGVRASSETWIKNKVFLSTGFSFSDVDNDLSGSRVYGQDFDVGYNPTLAQSLGFTDLDGQSRLHEYVVNLNLMFYPLPSLTLVPSLKVLKQELDGSSSGTQTAVGLNPDGPFFARSDRNLLDVSERLELRYNGVTNWTYYARGDWTQGEGKLSEEGNYGTPGLVNRYTEDSRLWQKYTIGATWYPLRWLNIDSQYYFKLRDNDYDHLTDNTVNTSGPGNRYPAYLVAQQFSTHDANCRLTLRPRRNITLVSRYDFQFSTIDTTPDPASAIGSIQTSEMISHILGQNATWMPWRRLYLQAGLNLVWSQTTTPTSDYTQAVLDSQNNYWTASLTSGFALDNKTDLQAQYFYYQADNYVDNSLDGVPYGVGAQEHSVTFGIIRRIRENIRLNLRYGFFTYRDDASAGHNDTDAHLVYSSLQFRF